MRTAGRGGGCGEYVFPCSWHSFWVSVTEVAIILLSCISIIYYIDIHVAVVLIIIIYTCHTRDVLLNYTRRMLRIVGLADLGTPSSCPGK